MIILVIILWTVYHQFVSNTSQERSKIIDKQEFNAAKSKRKMKEIFRENTNKNVDSLILEGTEEKAISTKHATIEFNTKKSGIAKYTLTKFFTWNEERVQLVGGKQGAVSFSVIFKDGTKLNQNELRYSFVDSIPVGRSYLWSDEEVIDLDVSTYGGDPVFTVRYFVSYGDPIIKIQLIQANQSYLSRIDRLIIHIGSPSYTERNSIDESSYSVVNLFDGERTKTITSDKPDSLSIQHVGGGFRWITIKNKYFGVSLIPITAIRDVEARIESLNHKLKDNGNRIEYLAEVSFCFPNSSSPFCSFYLLLGPVDYEFLSKYQIDLESNIDFGWNWLVRPISEFFLIPLFKILYLFTPNYGVVIILFTLLIKIILSPLTRTSFDSMNKIKSIQPKIEEIRKLYKNEQNKINEAIMKLYRENGINPLGGCLPLLIQLPILYGLFRFFSVFIELRKAEFVFWIKDLSTPDKIITLPSSIPIFGISEVSGLAALLCVTMYIQQKQSLTDPRQKAMLYIMPILFFAIFNGFPSGLNLYYLIFNVLSILQQTVQSRSKGWLAARI